MCIYACVYAYMSTCQCVMLADPHTEMIPKLLVTKIQILGRIISKLSPR